MSDTDLLFMPATHAAALIRAKKLSPVEYVDAVLVAIAEAQPHLNCFVTVMDEDARRDAKAAEQLVMDGAPLGPLHGVPVTVKDLIDVAGVRTTNGSAIYADNVATADDILVTRLRAAGTVIVGKSTTPEFGNKGITDGPSFGVTRNPWDLGRTTGGSSGGAAACVAAGLGPIALGTDGAGSVRIPAACCGLVGHKPTLGLVPIDGARDAFFNYTYAGPLSRTVTDAAVMHAALIGPGRGDPWSFGAQPRPLSPSLIGNDLSGLRVGFIERAANPRVAADMLAATRDSLAALADAGAEVEDVTETVDWIELPGRIMYQTNFTVFCEEFLPHWQNQMDPTVLAYMQRGSGFDMKQLRRAQYARTALFRAIEALLARYDVLVTPTLSRTALPADFDAANDQVMVDGVPCGITRQGWTTYVYPFNLTGHPALTVPSGFGTDGLPTATQIIGRWGADMDVFRIGAMLEQARPWAEHKPSFMK